MNYINNDDIKIYGPYEREDDREHVVLVAPNGNKKTVSYPKYIMEKEIGRKLNENEVVHHKDGDHTNNDKENLEIVDRSDHASYHAVTVEKVGVECEWCGDEFYRRPDQLNDR